MCSRQLFLTISVFLGRFVLDLSANTCQMRHMTLTLEVVALSVMGVFILHKHIKFEDRRPSPLEDIRHLLYEY